MCHTYAFYLLLFSPRAEVLYHKAGSLFCSIMSMMVIFANIQWDSVSLTMYQGPKKENIAEKQTNEQAS